MTMIKTGKDQYHGSQSGATSQREFSSSPPESQTPPPISPPPQTPPPPPPPPIYYPPQSVPPSVYSWEIYPHMARGLIQQKESKKPIFVIIGVFLIITFAMEFPIAGMLVYYSSSEGLDFGGTLTLQGEVRAEDGTGLSGARISIIGTDLSTISDAQGNYRIDNAPSGIWRVKASVTGYKEEAHKVLIHPGFSDTVDFHLEEGSGNEESNDLWFFISLAILMILFSPFIFAGSFYSFKRKRFSVALVGAILGIFTMTPSLALGFMPSVLFMGATGFILSSSALIMKVMNRKTFKRSRHTNTQAEHSRPV